MDHRRAGRAKMIPELHVDYCFMGSKGDATARDYEHKQVCDGKRGHRQGFVAQVLRETNRCDVSLVWKVRTLCFVATRSQPSRTC